MWGYAGWHRGVPGFTIDCSGMVSQCAQYSGFGYLNNAIKGHLNDYNGVKNIIHQETTREIGVNSIRDGDIFSIDADGHTGFVTEIVRNERGEVTGFKILHSRYGKGPEDKFINLLDEDDKYAQKYFANGKAKFYAWDTPDEDEPGFTGPKTSKMKTFQQIVQMALDQYDRDREKQVDDFWKRVSLQTERKLEKTRYPH